MKTFISLCLIFLITLFNSQHALASWARCHPAGPNTWVPVALKINQDPNLKNVVTFSAHGLVQNAGAYLDFKTLLVTGSTGAGYTWNTSSPYIHRTVGLEEYFALNHTTYLANLDEKSINVTMRALGTDGNELGCIRIILKSPTPTLTFIQNVVDSY